MKSFSLWDCVELDGSRWQIIAVEEDVFVLRSLDGPGVRLVPPGELRAAGSDAKSLSPPLADLDVTSLLGRAEQERLLVLADHLHELWYGTRSGAPSGTPTPT